MLDILIIIFVIALAIAPLSNFLPSKRQRQVARMREYAAVHGLFVEFRDLPGSQSATLARAPRPEQIIYYGRRLPPSRGQPRSRHVWVADAQGWRGLGHRLAAPACVERLPDGILALSQEESSCGVYWKEPGGEPEVQRIVEALALWNDDIQTP